jgi:hypothetical protein
MTTPHDVMYVFLTFLFLCALLNRLLKIMMGEYPRVLYIQPAHDWQAVVFYMVVIVCAVVLR